MIPLPRERLKTLHAAGQLAQPRFDCDLLQDGMGGDPWRVIVASCLLCKTSRRQAEPALRVVLGAWPTPGHLARADAAALEEVVRPCGLHRNRARQLTRMSQLWLTDSWEDARDLPGVGVYVADAVGLVCFGCRELDCFDNALREAADDERRMAIVG